MMKVLQGHHGAHHASVGIGSIVTEFVSNLDLNMETLLMGSIAYPMTIQQKSKLTFTSDNMALAQ